MHLDDKFDRIWKGYITKNGNKMYLFGINQVRTFKTRTGEILSDRSLSWDNKSFCNKAYCMTNNEE